MYVEYENNKNTCSIEMGSDSRMREKNWIDLEKNGWIVNWHRFDIMENYSHCGYNVGNKMDSWGCMAWSAIKKNINLEDAIDEWCMITRMDNTRPETCENSKTCDCGSPHAFYLFDDGDKYLLTSTRGEIYKYTGDYNRGEIYKTQRADHLYKNGIITLDGLIEYAKREMVPGVLEKYSNIINTHSPESLRGFG